MLFLFALHVIHFRALSAPLYTTRFSPSLGLFVCEFRRRERKYFLLIFRQHALLLKRRVCAPMATMLVKEGKGKHARKKDFFSYKNGKKLNRVLEFKLEETDHMNKNMPWVMHTCVHLRHDTGIWPIPVSSKDVSTVRMLTQDVFRALSRLRPRAHRKSFYVHFSRPSIHSLILLIA